MDDAEVARASLNPADFTSETWGKLTRMYEARLDRLRRQNDGVQLDHEATTALRGQIKEIKYFLALAKPAPEV